MKRTDSTVKKKFRGAAVSKEAHVTSAIRHEDLWLLISLKKFS